MGNSNKYITQEYKAMLTDSALVLSLVLFALIGVNTFFIIVAPTWFIRIFATLGLVFSILSAWLLYIVVDHFADCRDVMLIFKWIASFLCLILAVQPFMLYTYLNLDWELFANYGIKALTVFCSLENIILPLTLLLLISLIFWILTILLYKNSYTSYLFTTKKKEIYG